MQQEVYYDQNASTAQRSPGTNRHPPPALHRQSSRQFDAYGQMPNATAYVAEDPAATFNASRFDRMNSAFQNSSGAGYPGFDLAGGSQTWNPAAFAGPNTFNTFAPMNNRTRAANARGRANLPAVGFPLALAGWRTEMLTPRRRGWTTRRPRCRA